MAKGNIVKAGQLIGSVRSGNGGTGNHIYLEVRRPRHCDMCSYEPCCKCNRNEH